LVIAKTGTHEQEPMSWIANATKACPWWDEKRIETDTFMPKMLKNQDSADLLTRKIEKLGSEREHYPAHVEVGKTLKELKSMFRPGYFIAVSGALQSKAYHATATFLPDSSDTDQLSYDEVGHLEAMMGLHMVLDASVAEFAFAFAKAQKLRQNKGAANTKATMTTLLENFVHQPWLESNQQELSRYADISKGVDMTAHEDRIKKAAITYCTTLYDGVFPEGTTEQYLDVTANVVQLLASQAGHPQIAHCLKMLRQQLKVIAATERFDKMEGANADNATSAEGKPVFTKLLREIALYKSIVDGDAGVEAVTEFAKDYVIPAVREKAEALANGTIAVIIDALEKEADAAANDVKPHVGVDAEGAAWHNNCADLKELVENVVKTIGAKENASLKTKQKALEQVFGVTLFLTIVLLLSRCGPRLGRTKTRPIKIV